MAGAPLLQLSSANVDRSGVFLMDAGEAMYMLVGSATPTQVIQDLFDLPSFSAIPDDLVSSQTAEETRAFLLQKIMVYSTLLTNF